MMYTGREDENDEDHVSPMILEGRMFDGSYTYASGSTKTMSAHKIKTNEEFPIYVTCITYNNSGIGAELQHFYDPPALGKDDVLYIFTIKFTQ